MFLSAFAQKERKKMYINGMNVEKGSKEYFEQKAIKRQEKQDYRDYVRQITIEELTNKFDNICIKAGFLPLTTKDEKRYNVALDMYIKGCLNNDSGIVGKVIEILSCVPKSNKKKVARQGKSDFTIRVNNKLVPCERKTNGGRIDNIKTKYIVYSIDIDNSTGKCYIPPKVLKTETFINALYELNAVKTVRHNGIIDGSAIQVSNRKLWKWLENQLDFNRLEDYESNDII